MGKFHEIIGKYRTVQMDIKLLDETPVRAMLYGMLTRQIDILKEEIRRLLEFGVIEVGQSDYTSPMILAESPGKDPHSCIVIGS